MIVVSAACGHRVEVLDGFSAGVEANPCDECQKAELAAAARKRRQRDLARRRGGAGIPSPYHDLTLTELGERGWPGDAVLHAHAWLTAQDGLYLYGGNGTGKTTLAGAAAWCLAERREVRWVRASELSRWANGDFDSPEFQAVNRLVTGTAALVLDDLGQEIPSTSGTAAIREAIEHRVEHRLPLLITSNLRVSELASRPAYGSWLGSRLGGYCRQVEMAGPDHRLRP